MRKPKLNGNFFMCLLINMLINLEGAIPGAILLVLHFIFELSIWWSVGAFCAWIIYLLLWMAVLKWANSSSSKTEFRENKNPYSVGAEKNHKK